MRHNNPEIAEATIAVAPWAVFRGSIAEIGEAIFAAVDRFPIDGG
jgi:hypothetical protein